MTPESETRKDIRNAGKATFEHRHFATIAATLRNLRDMDLTAWQHETLLNQFADALAATNPRFDRAHFLKAARRS